LASNGRNVVACDHQTVTISRALSRPILKVPSSQ
jgi:hypothetical protein